MERRQQPRFPVHVTARITILSGDRQELTGTLESVSQGGMRITATDPLPENTAIKVEWGDGLALGDVCWCRAEGAGFSAGIRLQHSLGSLSDLETLARRLLGGSPRQEIGNPARPA
jgi:hypothetical protein